MKKLICLFLSCAIVFCCTISALSANESSFISAESALESMIVSETQNLLRAIEPEKELYGMGQVNFSNLKLGKQIPVYSYTTGGAVLDNSTRYYPILDGSKWVATATVSINESNVPIIQVSSEYAEDFTAEFSDTAEIALLFDANSAYIVSNEKTALAAIAPINDHTKTTYVQSKNALSLEFTGIKASYDLSLTSQNANVSRNADYYCYLPVPCIKQPTGSNACWAACIAAIRTYYGTETTIDNVYDFSGKTKYEGASNPQASNFLESYGFEVTWYYDNLFSWNTLRYYISSYSNPIYAGVSYDVNNNGTPDGGHAIVIRGYYVYQNIDDYIGQISYMDPLSGKYVVSNVSSESDLKYNASGSNVSHDIDAFLVVDSPVEDESTE